MLGVVTWAATIGYYIYLWKTRKVYTLDRVTLVIASTLLLLAVFITL